MLLSVGLSSGWHRFRRMKRTCAGDSLLQLFFVDKIDGCSATRERDVRPWLSAIAFSDGFLLGLCDGQASERMTHTRSIKKRKRAHSQIYACNGYRVVQRAQIRLVCVNIRALRQLLRPQLQVTSRHLRG